MAGTGTKYMAFLIGVHVLLFGAQADGGLPDQQGENPNKEFVNQFRGDNLTKEAQVQDDSKILDGTFSPAVKSLGFLNTVSGILVSPYTILEGSGLPQIIILLFQALTGLIEGSVIAGFLRGWEF